MIRLTPLRALTLASGEHPRNQAHLSAASGLVCAFGRVHVVADDELHLGVFDDAVAPGRLLRLFDGRLPSGKKARKRLKPDLEALLRLPPGPAWPQGALLALGSGSRPTRERAALLAFGPHGGLDTPAQAIDLAPLYAPLKERYDDLNIEGALLLGDRFVLLQRGNGAAGVNAALHYRWKDVAALLGGKAPTALRPRTEHRFALGRLDGVPLGFTDAAALPGSDSGGRWLFTAAAEDTDNSYADGGCAGSVLGLADASGRVLSMRRLAGRHKVEGIDARAQPGGWALCLVSDADDPAQASMLWRAWLGHAGRARSSR